MVLPIYNMREDQESGASTRQRNDDRTKEGGGGAKVEKNDKWINDSFHL